MKLKTKIDFLCLEYMYFPLPFQPGSFKQNSNCDTCQCIAGEVKCTPKLCAACDAVSIIFYL